MILFDRVKEFTDRRKMSLNEVEEAIGFSRNTLYKWKKQTPNVKNVKIVADYFDTSTDYLLGRTDNPARISDALDDFNDIPAANRETDLRKALENVMSFDGQEITDNDKDAIIAYMLGRKGQQ